MTKSFLLLCGVCTLTLLLAVGISLAGPASKATSKPAASQPTSAPASKPSSAPDWRNLFADKPWYKENPANEQVFTGTLEALKVRGIGTLMRPAHYKLGDRVVYTGTSNHPVLDHMVGKRVEIKGKAYDIELEGQAVSEIWPAAIRPAP